MQTNSEIYSIAIKEFSSKKLFSLTAQIENYKLLINFKRKVCLCLVEIFFIHIPKVIKNP